MEYMGILRNRDELLPVTCAILKENERESFFADVRRSAKGNMERVAQTVGVPVPTLQDWANGALNIPYIALQRLASEFSVEMPTVTELRREYQQMVPSVAPRRPTTRMPSHPGPVGGAGRAETRQEPRREGPRVAGGNDYEPLRPQTPAPARPERPQRQERGGRRRNASNPRPPKAAQKPPRPAVPAPARPQRIAAPRHAAGPRAPKLSAQAAYWAGAALAAARRDGDAIVLSADRRVGQNFAVTWANLSHDIFGVKPTLAFSADELSQEARLPIAGLEEFVGRLGLKTEAMRPPAPRWVWSNPDWKKAFLKGLVDASAEFRRDPELHLTPLGDHLRRSAEKLFASLSLTPRANEDGSLSISGQEAVEKYYAAVGSDNMKLRDQMKAFFHIPGAAVELAGTATLEGMPAAVTAPAEKAPARGRGRRRRGRRGGRSRAAAPSAPGAVHTAAPAPVPPAADDTPPEV